MRSLRVHRLVVGQAPLVASSLRWLSGADAPQSLTVLTVDVAPSGATAVAGEAAIRSLYGLTPRWDEAGGPCVHGGGHHAGPPSRRGLLHPAPPHHPRLNVLAAATYLNLEELASSASERAFTTVTLEHACTWLVQLADHDRGRHGDLIEACAYAYLLRNACDAPIDTLAALAGVTGPSNVCTRLVCSPDLWVRSEGDRMRLLAATRRAAREWLRGCCGCALAAAAASRLTRCPPRRRAPRR